MTGTTDETVGDVTMVKKQLVGHVDNAAYPAIAVDIQLTLTTPEDAKGPVPVIMEFGFGGRPGCRRRRAGGRRRRGPTWQQQVLAKGWGYAIIVPTASRPTTARG